MKHVLRLSILALLLVTPKVTHEEKVIHFSNTLEFDDVKHFIAFYESTNGQYKFNQNSDGSIDCGVYQINSQFFDSRRRGNREVKRAFDSIYAWYHVSKSFPERTVETIRNDRLNEDLARYLYNLGGIEQWVCFKKFKSFTAGYSFARN
jgi:hypothetical protein